MVNHAEQTDDLQRFIFIAMTSTREVLKAEQLLKEAELRVKVVPLPRHRGALCGVALRFPPADERAALAVLARSGIEIAARDEIDDYV